MKTIFVFVALLYETFSYAQNFYNLDSLKLAVRQAPDDKSKVSTLAAITFNYAFRQPDTGLLYGKQAITLAKQTGDKESVARTLFSYGWALWAAADYDKAADFALQSLQQFQKSRDYEMMASANNLLAVIFRDVNDYPTALGYSDAAKHIIDSFGFFKKNVNIAAAWGTMLTIRSTIFLLGRQLDSAYHGMQKFFSVYPLETTGGFPVTTMARIATAQKDYSKALYYFKASITGPTGAYADILDSYSGIAGLYLEMGKPDSAIYYCRKVFELNSNMAYKLAIRDAVQVLAGCYIKKKVGDSAIKYLQLSSALKDSLYNQEKIRSIQNLGFNAQLQKQEEAAAKAGYQNRLKMYVLAGLLSVFLLIGIMLVRNNQQRKKANDLLQSQKNKVETTLNELKAAQTQLVQREKMASLGELTAGIAHEIQNPLNFVNNFSETNTELIEEAQEELKAGNHEEVATILNDIKDNEQKVNHHGKRAEAIVKGMLQHSRTSTGEKQLTDINALCDEYLRLAYHGLRAKDKTFNAILQTDFDPSLGKLAIVPQDMGRVLLNLFNNAFYSMAEKQTKTPEGFEPALLVGTKKANTQIEIRVADNGMGISKSVQDKIFQPFFTTKPAGQGTGLGLSLSYDIIKANGGDLLVASTEGEGATFIIKLPV